MSKPLFPVDSEAPVLLPLFGPDVEWPAMSLPISEDKGGRSPGQTYPLGVIETLGCNPAEWCPTPIGLWWCSATPLRRDQASLLRPAQVEAESHEDFGPLELEKEEDEELLSPGSIRLAWLP